MQQQTSTDAATPGSDAAIALGCTCPRVDNNYGHGLTDIDDGEIAFWIAGNCPLHADDARELAHLYRMAGLLEGDDDES